MLTTNNASEKAIQYITQRGGMIRANEAYKAGIHSRTLNRLEKEGSLEQISRGIYRLTAQEAISNRDLITVAARVPQCVICLISALSFHNMTTQIPHKVYIAMEGNGARSPRLDYPPLAIHRFTGKAFQEGIEKHLIDNVYIQIYNPEKTLADCFKFRNQIGMDVVIEALKFYKARKKFNMKALTHYTRICRVEKVARPYLEALI